MGNTGVLCAILGKKISKFVGNRFGNGWEWVSAKARHKAVLPTGCEPGLCTVQRVLKCWNILIWKG